MNRADIESNGLGKYGFCPVCGSGYVNARCDDVVERSRLKTGEYVRVIKTPNLTPECLDCGAQGETVHWHSFPFDLAELKLREWTGLGK